MTFEEKDGNLIIGQMTEGQKADFEKFFNYYIYSATKAKNILPRPVIRDGNGKLIKDHTPRDFYLKLQEEIFEVIRAYDYAIEIANMMNEDVDEPDNGHLNKTAEEIADVITVCISYLNAIGYDEKGRSEIFRRVNEKNEKRGYFRNA